MFKNYSWNKNTVIFRHSSEVSGEENYSKEFDNKQKIFDRLNYGKQISLLIILKIN